MPSAQSYVVLSDNIESRDHKVVELRGGRTCVTQRAPFYIGAMAKKGTLSQHFVTHVVPPLG